MRAKAGEPLVSSAAPIMLRYLSVSVLLFGAATLSCSTSTDDAADGPSSTLYVYSPFDGVPPYFHLATTSELTPMTPVGTGCGWYSVPYSQGPFRFYEGYNWDGRQWGPDGMCTPPPKEACYLNVFQPDALVGSAALYVWADPTTGSPMVDTVQPFECDPGSSGPPPNPYLQGALPSLARERDAQRIFDIWLQFYEESGDLGRIKFDDPAVTVSEGIGYGMLIFAFMDVAGEQRARFDALHRYYQHFSNEHGLMHWKVSGFDTVVEANAATDADLDVAVALLVAHRRWGEPAGDDSYLTAALTLANAIRQYEFDAAGYLKPGDAWDTAKNPSYVSPVAFELFRQLDVANAAFWTSAIDRHYGLLAAAAHPTTGLVPNWSDTTGAPANPLNGYANWDAFGFDAIRVPWRAAWAHAWFGHLPEHTRAATVARGICAFIATATGGDATQIKAEYRLDGTDLGVAAGPGIVGAYSAACMVDPTQSAILDATYGAMKSQLAAYDVTYYQTSLQLLEALLLSGKMPNPY